MARKDIEGQLYLNASDSTLEMASSPRKTFKSSKGIQRREKLGVSFGNMTSIQAKQRELCQVMSKVGCGNFKTRTNLNAFKRRILDFLSKRTSNACLNTLAGSWTIPFQGLMKLWITSK